MKRTTEIAAGFVLMLVASGTAVQFFLTHQRYENAASIPYLVALGVAELFLVGLSWRLMFVPLTTTQDSDVADFSPTATEESFDRETAEIIAWAATEDIE